MTASPIPEDYRQNENCSRWLQKLFGPITSSFWRNVKDVKPNIIYGIAIAKSLPHKINVGFHHGIYGIVNAII
jgi:hypothetical protein